MEKILRNKKKGIKRFFKSFKYSIDGLLYAYKNEQSLYIHLLGTIIAIILGFIFQIRLIEWAIMGIGLGFILAIELINTSIEAAIDLYTLEINPLAKIAKDCASAAAFVATIMVIIAAIAIYIPYLTEMISR